MSKLTFLLLLVVLLVQVQAQFEDPVPKSIPPATLAKYYTDTVIQSDSIGLKKCTDRVFKERQKTADNGGPTLGVVPTVGLGMAMLLFLFVGIFAAGIAQAFQMVSLLGLKNINGCYFYCSFFTDR